MNARRFEVDLVKAVGIVAVVLIHSLRPFFAPDVSRTELRILQLTQFAVPGFLAASGFLYASSQPISWTVTRGRLRRLLAPYLVASIAAQGFWFAFEGRAPGPSVLLEELLLASSFGPFYYVLQAVLFALASPAFSRLGPRSLRALTAAAIAAQWAAWFLPEPPLFWAVRNPLHWMAFFLAGWWLGIREPAGSRWLANHRLPMGLMSAVGLGAASFFGPMPKLGSQSQPMSWLAVWCALCLILTLAAQREARHRAVRFLSDSTYTIYLFHLFFVVPVQRLVPAAAGVFDPLAIGAAWLAGMLGPLALAAGGRAVLGRHSRTILGS
jgi:fucose 4-O-acetylase-like acetyltransferase